MNTIKIILTLFIIYFSYVPIYSQKQIFTYDSEGKVITKSEYIDSFDNGSYQNMTPYTLKTSETILSDTPYSIRCSKYNGWDNEPGDFQVIEILTNGKTIYTLKKDEGWIYLQTEWASLGHNKTCYAEKLSKDASALIFIGTTIASQPPFLTIIVIKNGIVSLVFNKPFFIEDIQKDNYTKFRLQANTVEWIDKNQPHNHPIINTLSIKDGLIYFR